jgi:aspartyl-tRNA(Asn)/glutamyl-tRNA(Gln) amidotransferase subunit A
MGLSNSDILKLSAFELAEGLHAGDFNARAIVDAYIRQIEAVDPNINAYIVTNFEKARLVADHIDLGVQKFGLKRADLTPEGISGWKAVKTLGDNCEVAVNADGLLHPMAGVPIAVKDVVVTKGVQSTSGSKILEGWIPPYDASLVLRLKQAGMPILGKTNMDEFAMGSSTEHSAYGVTHNPWKKNYIPGGSGGGSAAAVAAFEAPLAIGTDTGGSIRQPAAVTGTVGAKPTYGAVSRYGLIALASSLDQAGPCARNVLDTAILQDVLQGHDVHDSTSLEIPWPSNFSACQEGVAKGLESLTIGIIKELSGDGFAPEVKARFDEVVEKAKELGAKVVEVSCPHFEYALGAYYLIMPSEASSNLAKFDGMRYGQRVDAGTVDKMMSSTRGKLLGDEVKRRIILGTYALSSGYYDAYYGSAQKVRTLVQNDFNFAFEKCDVLVTPTAPTVAFKFGEKLDDPMAMYLNDIATIPANLAGVPGLSIPSGLAEEGLPAGVQIIADVKEDAKMYRVAAALEKGLGKLPSPKVDGSLI